MIDEENKSATMPETPTAPQLRRLMPLRRALRP